MIQLGINNELVERNIVITKLNRTFGGVLFVQNRLLKMVITG
jgi:hypothetical protein